uniref:Uncharacterized protein n=1 Tax=Tanacetum cinerariifolium TaxID=118510 RepID=A0A6L2JMJ8_TANCI|nr:hypothetical protein [Tanacetum cinerariifolium]
MALYHALIKSILEDEDAMDKGVADMLKKRKPDDADKDEGPPARPDQGLKRKKTSKKLNHQRRLSQLEPPKAQPNRSLHRLPKRPPTPDPEWNKGKTVDDGPTQNWLSDLSKAERSSKTLNELMSTPIDFTAFAMNRLQISDLTNADFVGPVYKLLKGTCKSYVELEYNMKECTSHWGPKRQRLYKYASNRVSTHDAYSRKRTLALTNVKLNKWYGHGHLEEIKVQRSDKKWYKFMKGDFLRLHRNDIEDMLLLVIQNRLNDLDGEVIVHFVAALQMGYTEVMSTRRWINLDKKRSRIMVKDIDRQLLERRLKKDQENDKIGSKRDKNGKRGKAEKC